MNSSAPLRAELHDLSLLISHQKLVLHELEGRWQKLQTQLDSIVYPVLTLPPEIASEIFVHCLPVDGKRELDVVNPREAPLLLMHICKRWRKIALSTPPLWSIFELAQLDDLAHTASVWFERARMCPLSIKIQRLSADLVQDFPVFMEIFRQHSRQVRSLELHTEMFNDLEQMGSPFDLTRLQKLSIYLQSSHQDHHGAPYELSLNMGPSLLTLPWVQVTKFTAESYTPSQCLEALGLMPNLTDCVLAATRQSNLAVAPIFSHPNIRHLTLLKSGYGACSAIILDMVTLPALQTLEIRNVHDFTKDIFNSFIHRSLPPLQTLVLYPRNFLRGTELIISAPFAALGLTELEIGDPSTSFVKEFFQSLDKNTAFLPRLQSLAFRKCQRTSVDEILRIAADPVTQRRNNTSGSPLRLFHVVSETLEPSYPETLLLPFRKLKESGVDIHIESSQHVSFI
ncbi:hypothetical protein C8R46DRAFT_1093547 [Mycena filopes]|nr:hypothetical protein C8R46DRAFT_1093547 [Mycena filopes]